MGRPSRICTACGRSGSGRRFGLGLLHRIDAHLVAAPALVLEAHHAVDQRVDGVVGAQPDVVAGVPLGPALTQDDVAGRDLLAAVLLDAAVLRIAVAAVARGADAFLVSHCYLVKPRVMSLMRTSVKPCRWPRLRA